MLDSSGSFVTTPTALNFYSNKKCIPQANMDQIVMGPLWSKTNLTLEKLLILFMNYYNYNVVVT